MKTLTFLILAVLAISLSACSTAPKKECCSSSGACCARH
jgi:starvation-inducible outer membrane lipoprotein